jgi:hypothetical protein
MAADPNAVITTLPRAGVKSPAQYRADWHIPLNENWTLIDTYAGFLNVASSWTQTQTFTNIVVSNNVETGGITVSDITINGVVELTAAASLTTDGGVSFITEIKHVVGSSLSFGLIGAGAQASQNVNMAGADTSWAVIASPQGSIGSGLTWNSRISSTGVATITVSNITGGGITPSTVNWTLIGFEGTS